MRKLKPGLESLWTRLVNSLYFVPFVCFVVNPPEFAFIRIHSRPIHFLLCPPCSPCPLWLNLLLKNDR